MIIEGIVVHGNSLGGRMGFPTANIEADAALDAGIDARHGLIGPGVYASHGYERSHRDGVKNTFELLKAYLG
jgi:putative aminopeptidase FrvX